MSENDFHLNPLASSVPQDASTSQAASPAAIADTTGSPVLDRVLGKLDPELMHEVAGGRLQAGDALDILKSLRKLRVRFSGNIDLDAMQIELTIAWAQIRKDRKQKNAAYRKCVRLGEKIEQAIPIARQLRAQIQACKTN